MGLMDDPDAVIAYTQAPAPEADDVIAAVYKFPDGHGVLLAQQDLLRRFIQEQCPDYTTNAKPLHYLSPILKNGEWDGKSKVKVEEFAYKPNRPNEGLLWKVRDSDDPNGKPLSTKYWFHPGTHACRAGKGFAMPRPDLPPRTGRANVLMLDGIHWIRRYLVGYEDLFEIPAQTLNEMRRLGSPRPPQPRVEHSAQELGTTAAVEADAGTRTVRGVPLVARHVDAEVSPWEEAARLREAAPDGYAWGKAVCAQTHLTIEANLPPPLLGRLLLDAAELYYKHRIVDVPALEDILTKRTIVDALARLGAALVGTSVDEELILQVASKGVVHYGFEPYDRAVQLFRQVLDLVNQGEFPDPPLDFAFQAEDPQPSVLRGRSIHGKQPTRKTTFYRVVPRAMASEQHEEGETWTSLTN